MAPGQDAGFPLQNAALYTSVYYIHSSVALEMLSLLCYSEVMKINKYMYLFCFGMMSPTQTRTVDTSSSVASSVCEDKCLVITVVAVPRDSLFRTILCLTTFVNYKAVLSLSLSECRREPLPDHKPHKQNIKSVPLTSPISL